MYEVTGQIKGMNIDIKTDKMVLELAINEKQTARTMFDELEKSEKLKITLSQYKKKRSLDANAYAWVLIGKLSEKVNRSKEEIYRDYIKDIGGNYDVVCIQDKAVDKLCEIWKDKGIGWQTDILPSKIDGCTNLILYYGSSTYDTAQMSRLLDLIIEDCKLQNIDTRTPDEIERLMSMWDNENEEK